MDFGGFGCNMIHFGVVIVNKVFLPTPQKGHKQTLNKYTIETAFFKVIYIYIYIYIYGSK